MEYKSLPFDTKDVSASERMIAGYASTFGNVDEVGDTIERGAFAESIKSRFPAKQVKVLWQHRDPLGLPVKMVEDDKGLYVEARISKTRLGDEALELMRDGVVDRMSIGFSTVRSEDTDTGRLLKDLTLYEFSPVTFPADTHAAITNVKQLCEQIDAAEARKGLEEILRKSGFSRAAAAAFVAKARSMQDQGQPDAAHDVLAILKARTVRTAHQLY